MNRMLFPVLLMSFSLSYLSHIQSTQGQTKELRPGAFEFRGIVFSVDKTLVQVDENVTFTLAAPEGVIKPFFQFVFTFGDGESASTQPNQTQVGHVFRNPGTYTVSVRVISLYESPDVWLPPIHPGSLTVQIEPLPGPAPQQASAVQLNVDKNSARIGEELTFSLTPAEVVANSAFLFTFDFGDGTKKIKDAGHSTVTHSYNAPGSYTASVSVTTPVGAEIFETGPSIKNNVTVQINPILPVEPPARTVQLIVNPADCYAGDSVFFEAKIDSPDASIRYSFNFGDGSPTSEWSKVFTATHFYSSAGTFSAYVEIGAMIEGIIHPITRSESQNIHVAQVPPPNGVDRWFWVYLAGGLAALVVGYRVMKSWFGAKPTFHACPDQGTSYLKDRKGHMAIDYEVRLNRNLVMSDYRFNTTERKLIRDVRRKK